jgi:molybdenum cofactor cytidylyltransferase
MRASCSQGCRNPPRVLFRRRGLAAAKRYDHRVIPAIVLAAGKSARMGRTKAVLPLGDDDTFLSRIVRTFHEARVDDVMVVVGHDAGTIRASLARSGLRARFVDNPEYESGQFSSFLKGLDAADRYDVSAVLLTLVDVPLVTAATVRAVVEHYLVTNAPIVRPTRGREHGHPVLIDRTLFDEFRRADPAGGAKPIVRAHASVSGDLAIEDDGAYLDIDTVTEYERVLGLRGLNAPVSGRRAGDAE